VRNGFNVEQTIRELKLEKLVDMGMAEREACRAALVASGWDIEQAATKLLS